jgi:hypothetical protein
LTLYISLQVLDVVSGTVQVTAFLRFAALTEELIRKSFQISLWEGELSCNTEVGEMHIAYYSHT